MAVSTNTPARLQLGVGDIAWAGTDMGATSREGSFTVEQTIYWPELGGSKGPIAGTGWIINETALLTMTLKELTVAVLAYAIPGLVESSDGTSEYSTTPNLGLIAEGDHATVKWTGVTAGAKAVEIYLYRAYPEPGITWTVTDDAEWEAEVTWRSYYLKTAVAARSWQIYIAE